MKRRICSSHEITIFSLAIDPAGQWRILDIAETSRRCGYRIISRLMRDKAAGRRDLNDLSHLAVLPAGFPATAQISQHVRQL